MIKYISRLLTISFFVLLVAAYLSSLCAGDRLAEAAKGGNIYFLTGDPTPKSAGTFPSSLYKIDQAKAALVLVRNIVPQKWGTDFIYYYYDQRIIMIGQYYDPHLKFVLLEMDDPLKEKSFEISYCDNCTDVDAHFFDVPHKGLFQGLELVRRSEGKLEVHLSGMNLSTMKQKELPRDLLKYMVVSGIPGASLVVADSFYVKLDSDKRILIPFGRESIQTDWKLSDEVSFSEKDFIVAYINNAKMLVLGSRETRVENPKGLGYSTYFIFDKKIEKWHSVKFKGGRSRVKGFGQWIAGFTADVVGGRESPGREKRRQEMTATGRPADWRFEWIYSPGILILYNVNTRKKYTIETNQGDSEVLLVENNTVYYRSNRSIYKAEIGEKEIKKGTLLIENDIVPDIHWAFMKK